MTGPNGSVGGNNSAGGVNKVSRSLSGDSGTTEVVKAVMSTLIKALNLAENSPTKTPEDRESADGERQRRHSESDLQSGIRNDNRKEMPLWSPTNVANLPIPPTVRRGSDSPTDGVVRNLLPELDANDPSRSVAGGAVSEPDGVQQKLIFSSHENPDVEAKSTPSSFLSSPIRTRNADDVPDLDTLKESIKNALQDAFSPSSSSPSKVRAESSYKPLENDPSPAAIATTMKNVYGSYKNKLDVFVETFGEVLAEKASTHPEAFHEFFQKIVGNGLFGYQASMLDRFKDGFRHRLGKIQKESPPTVGDVSAAQKKILHANIAGGNSCIKNLEETLDLLVKGMMGTIDADDPRLLLIRDISEILMSDTNRGNLSDPNSVIARLSDAVLATPKLVVLLGGSVAGQTLLAVLESEYETQNSALGKTIPIGNLDARFYDALKVAAVLDAMNPLPDALSLDEIVGRNVEPPFTSTRVAELYLKIAYPPMKTDIDFSAIQTRSALDDIEEGYHRGLSKLVTDTFQAIPTPDPRILNNLQYSLVLYSRTAREADTEIETQKNARLQELQSAFETNLQELQSAFETNLRESRMMPATPASIRNLHDAFVDLYRPGEEGYDGHAAMLSMTARGGMSDYSTQEVSKILVPRFATNESFDDKLGILNRTIRDARDASTFIRHFTYGDGSPLHDLFTEQLAARNVAVETKLKELHGLLPTKLQVAQDKLNGATATLTTALKDLYTTLGKDTPDADAHTEVTRLKAIAMATIQTGSDLNLQANTTSVAADTLNVRASGIRRLKTAYADARSETQSFVTTLARDLQNNPNASSITLDVLTAMQTTLEQQLDDVLSRFHTANPNRTDPPVATVSATLAQNKAEALSTGVGVIRDFAARGIQDRRAGESDADRLAYLQTESNRLGRFLPESTHAEGQALRESENSRLAAEASQASQAAAAAAAAAKADMIADINTAKATLLDLRDARDELRSRRPAGEADDLGQTTLRLATAFGELHELDDTSTDLGILAYRDAMTAYRDAVIAEMGALQVRQAADVQQLAQTKQQHAQALQHYSLDIDQPFVSHQDLGMLEHTLQIQGDKPHAETMSAFKKALQADMQAMKVSRAEYANLQGLANQNFDSAVQTLTTTLRAFHATIGVADTAAQEALGKADRAKHEANVAGDPHVDVQITRTDAATGRVKHETSQILALTTDYKIAQNAIAENTRTYWADDRLAGKLQSALSTFNTQTEGMPAVERDAARLSLQHAIETAQKKSDAAKALVDEMNAPPPAPAKKRPSSNPVDPNVAIRSAQLVALKGVTETLTNSLNAVAKTGRLDDFHTALGDAMHTLSDANDAASLVQGGAVRTAFEQLRIDVAATHALSTSLTDARPADAKLETLRQWQKQCQPVVDNLNTVPKAWKLPLTTELKKYQDLRATKKSAFRAANDTLQKRLDTLAQTLQRGGLSMDDAKARARQTLSNARALHSDDMLMAAENAILIMDHEIEVATENNRLAAVARAEVAAMAIATQRLDTATQGIRAEYAGDPAQDTRVTDEVDNAQAQVVTRFGDGPATSESTTAKAQILEARLAEIRDAKQAAALAEAQALMATARQGVSDATAVLGDRLSAWASVAGLAVPTTEMIVADMVTKLFSGRSKESLSPEELDTLRQHIDLRSAAYQDITDAANYVVVTWGYQDLARGVIAEVIYGDTAVPTKPEKSIIATEKLHDAAQTLRARATEAQQATAASQLRTGELRNLETLRTKLGQVLARDTNSMAERRALLQEASALLGTISTETNRLFPDDTAKESKAAHTAFKNLSRQVQNTYSRFCTTDSRDLLSQSDNGLGGIDTASGSGLDAVSNGLQRAHETRRAAFNTAYTIDGLSSAPRDAGLATLDGFTGHLAGAVAGRRVQLDSIRKAYAAANSQLLAAFDDAQRDIDFKKTTASELNAKTSTFAAACADAERRMNTALRNIPPDADQLQVFGGAVTRAQSELKAAFTTGVSTRLQSDIRSFEELIADMGIYTTEDPSTYTASALRMRARAIDLAAFMTVGLADEITTVTQRHFGQVLAVAHDATKATFAAATAAVTTGVDANMVSQNDLDTRMAQFATTLSNAIETFESAVEKLPADTTITDTLRALRTTAQASGPIAKTALMTLVSTPLETQRQGIEDLLVRDGLTLADLQAVSGVVDAMESRSVALGAEWVSTHTEIEGTVGDFSSKLGVLKATRNTQILKFTDALGKLTFSPVNPFGITLQEKWGTIRDHEGQVEQLRRDYAHLLQEAVVDPRITAAQEACRLRAAAAKNNFAPEQAAILSAIPSRLATLAANFDWNTVLTGISEGLSQDVEIRTSLKAAGNASPGLEAAIRGRLMARDTVETAKQACIAWRPGQSADTVLMHHTNVLFLEFPAVPFDATAFDAGLSSQIGKIGSHVTAIQTLATPASETSLKKRWQQIDRYEAATVDLAALDPSKKNGALQAQISDIKTHLNGYAMPSAVEKETFHGSLNASLSDERLMTSEAIMGEALFLSLEIGGSGHLKIQSPKFAAAIQAAAAEATSLAPDVLSRITYRTHVIAAERLLTTMGGLEQGIAELETALTNLAAKPAENTILASHDAGQSRRAEAAKVAITARITELKAHAQRLTEAVDTANTALDTARRTAEILTSRQVGTETADTLNARMTALDRDANAALAAFDRAVAGLPANQARQDARSALEFLTGTLDGATKTQLQNSVSAPLQTIKDEINGLLGRMGTTQADLENKARVVENLEARLKALGDTWLTAGLGDEIRTTIKAYDSRLDAMRTRTGQIQTLADALNGLNFAVPANATFADKWNKIGENDNSQIALREHSDFFSLFNEEPKNPAITHALTELEVRRTAAIEHRDPEQRALIAGLADQLGGLTTAGFDWDATLTTAETAVRNTLPVDLRDNAEMQAVLTAARGGLVGLQNAVITRVTAREALDTATASLGGWPASGLSLVDIGAEVTAAQRTFRNKEPEERLLEWDLATEVRVATLAQQLAANIRTRDTLIDAFQAIIDTPLPEVSFLETPSETLSTKWTAILGQVNAAQVLHEVNVAGTGTGLISDPQVAAKVQETQTNLRTKIAVTDVERSAFRDAMNVALLACDPQNPPQAAGLLDSAATQLRTGMSPAIQANRSFQAAIGAVRLEADAAQAAITERIAYRQGMAQADYLLGQVLRGEQPSQSLMDHLNTLAAPAHTAEFGVFDTAMVQQRTAILRALQSHQQRVLTATLGITTSQQIIANIPADATVTTKWMQLQQATDTFYTALGDQGVLWGQRADGQFVYHPDINGVAQAAVQAWNVAAYGNVGGEATAVRRYASDCLVAFMSDTKGLIPEPTFEDSQASVLPGLGIPAGVIGGVAHALAGQGIQTEIQTRMDLHEALRDLEADSSPPIAKKPAIDAAKTLMQTCRTTLANPAYATCDGILADRLQTLQTEVYGVLAEETAQAMLVNATTLHITEAKEAGTTSSLIKMGALWQNLESEFRNPAKGPGWKYHVSLDDAFQGVLDPSTPPKDTDEFIGFLRTAIERLNLQAGPTGLPDPYQRIAETALQRLEGRNTGTPQLCAWAMSANLRLVMSVIENFGDTRAAGVYNGMAWNSMSLHEGITLKKQDATSLTGYSRDHGALWSSLHQQPIDFMPIQNIAAENIPGFHISEDQFCALIEKIGTPDSRGLAAISGYIPAGTDEASLTKAGRDAFFAMITRDDDLLAFLELGFPNDGSLSVRECYRRWEALLKNETEYKHLRYLFGRKFERVYQELVLENL